MIIVVGSVFHEGSKYYPQVFLMNVCMNYIDMSKEIDANKTRVRQVYYLQLLLLS